MASAGRPRSYVRSPAAKLKTVGGGQAVYVRERRAIHVLNPTARLVYEVLDEPASFDELVEILAQATDGEAARIAAELEPALAELVRCRILDEVT